MSSHVHHSIFVTRSPDPQIVELRAELSGLKDLIAEKDRSADRERQDQKEARDKAEDAVNARLASLNALKEQRGEDRATFAPREAMDVRLDALDELLVQSREDRATIHVRLDALGSLTQKVDTNTAELDKAREHIHQIANDLTTLMGKPPQFNPDEEADFKRLRTLALKFSMDDGFMPFEMDELHDMVKERQGKEKVKERRFGTLEAAGFSALGTIVAFEVLPNILHAIFGR